MHTIALLRLPAVAAFSACLALGSGSCAGGTSANPAAPTTPPSATNTITLTAAGASPQNIQITAGTRVLFVNNDSRSHNMVSDLHPDHRDCPEINQVGLLSPGQSRETGNLVTVRTCGFHDHDLPNNAGLLGSIVIQ